MRFRALFLFGFFFASLLIGSCSKGLSTEKLETRLIGTWKVEQVKFKRNGCYKDVTQNFNQYKFTYAADGTLILVDTKVGESHEGYWYIDEEYVWDEEDQENDLVQTLIMAVYNTDANLWRDFRWKDLSVSNSKLKSTERRDGRRYKWELVR